MQRSVSPGMIATLPRVLAAFLIFLAAPAAAQQIDFSATREGDFIAVTASTELPVGVRAAWDVLTDYDHLADFIPDMQSSRVVLRTADGVLVEQKGAIDFFIFSQPVEVTLAVVEDPMRRITARGVAGNLNDVEARYDLEPAGAGVRLRYQGRFLPSFSVPPIIGMPLVRRVLQRRFRAMVDEILRRDAAARGKGGR